MFQEYCLMLISFISILDWVLGLEWKFEDFKSSGQLKTKIGGRFAKGIYMLLLVLAIFITRLLVQN